MNRKINTARGHGTRCRHRHCSDCRTKRGNRRGNRRLRQAARRRLHTTGQLD